jgi:hypothetical protein
MDKKRKVLFFVVMMLLSNMKMCLHGAPLEESIINKDLTGQDLIKMGNSLNKPLLELLGATFVKTEQNINKELSDNIAVAKNNFQDGIDKLTMELCKETRCAAWTEWSRCSAYMTGTFGARTRSRKCGGNSSICAAVSAESVEIDNQICQGTCNHTLTGNKFCILLNKSVTKTQNNARDACHKDGGHLMNMDSELKFKDVNEYFTNISFKSDVWIDGKRTLPNGNMKYEYGSDDSKFSIWQSGEPGSTDDCKIYNYRVKSWYGRSCTNGYNYLCEIL